MSVIPELKVRWLGLLVWWLCTNLGSLACRGGLVRTVKTASGATSGPRGDPAHHVTGDPLCPAAGRRRTHLDRWPSSRHVAEATGFEPARGRPNCRHPVAHPR